MVKAEDRLLLIDENEKGISYLRKILEILSDAPRPGAPNTFTAEQVCQIMSLACDRPEDSELPISHWSLNSLVNEIISRGIAESISRSQMAAFLKSWRHKASYPNAKWIFIADNLNSRCRCATKVHLR